MFLYPNYQNGIDPISTGERYKAIVALLLKSVSFYVNFFMKFNKVKYCKTFLQVLYTVKPVLSSHTWEGVKLAV